MERVRARSCTEKGTTVTCSRSDRREGTRAQGFKYYVEAEDPDILVLTETKAHGVVFGLVRIFDVLQVNNEPVDPVISARYPYRTWAISDKKTYGGSACVSCQTRALSADVVGGTAVLSKIKPISVTKLLPGHPNPEQVKGRLVTLEFDGCYVVCTYVTNAGQNLKVFYPVCASSHPLT